MLNSFTNVQYLQDGVRYFSNQVLFFCSRVFPPLSPFSCICRDIKSIEPRNWKVLRGFLGDDRVFWGRLKRVDDFIMKGSLEGKKRELVGVCALLL